MRVFTYCSSCRSYACWLACLVILDGVWEDGFSHQASAAAKKAASGGLSCPVNPQVANPVRPAVLTQIGTKAFQLPNGRMADLNMDLQSMLNTVVTSNSNLAPMDPLSLIQNPDPCESHLEIRSAVTNFKLDLVQLGVSIGFTPTGPLSGVTSVTGKTNLNIGTISMDFSVWKCTQGKCVSVGASSANQATVGGDLSLEVDFSIITAGPSLVWSTPLGAVLKKIMQKGISDLVASDRIIELPWRARVREYFPGTGTLIFDAGLQSRLTTNQNFEVYAPVDYTSTGKCEVYRVVAYVHSTQVNEVSSTAVVDQALDTRGVHDGDIVMIRAGSFK